MAPSGTNYAEIQNDEIEALRSIYMEAFEEEEAKVGAWNTTSDRAFRITLKPTDRENDTMTLTVHASFPATYPKTLPKLSLSFSEAFRHGSRAEAEDVLKAKPRRLLGSEMMFEVTTSLQDLLDQAAQRRVHDVPALDQERANQQAVVTQQAKEKQEEKRKEKHQANIEEEQYLAEMVEKQKTRDERRREKLQSMTSRAPDSVAVPDVVRFDQPACIKDPQGNELVIDSVYGKILFREGPVTKIWLVRHIGAAEGSSFFLVLKTCQIPSSSEEALLKKHIQSLESKLDGLTHLPVHQNIIHPLAFKINRSQSSEMSANQGWTISVLMQQAGKGSLHDLLEITSPVDLAVGRAWIIQILEGLGHYHRRGLAHASVHTQNILLEKVETGRITVKLADGGYQLGLHRLKDADWTHYAAAASIYWTAPELANDCSTCGSPALDIWNLGITILQMFFGLDIQSKHQSPTAFLESTTLSSSFDRLLRSMFHSEAKKRPSAWELVSSAFLRNDDPIFQETVDDSPTSTRSQRRGSSHVQRSNSRFTIDFVQEGRLGKGGYGSVVKARNRLDSNFYAVKIINKCTESALDKVLNEVRLLSQLNHPNVVRYYTAWKEIDNPPMYGYHNESSEETESSTEGSEVSDLVFPRSSGGLDFIGSNNDKVFSDDETTEDESEEVASIEDDGIVFGEDDDDTADKPRTDPDDMGQAQPVVHFQRQSNAQQEAINNTLYIQMEYCEKQTLRDVIKSGIQDNAVEVWRYFRQVLQGLAHIHAASIVHRDLKPENIFIDSGSNVRIGDFGLARPGEFLQLPVRNNHPNRDSTRGHGTFTRSVGTTFYVAPEVKSNSVGQGNYDEKADMFSLGIIFFEMNYRLETGMERVHTLGALCKPDSTVPAAFAKDGEKAKQAQIVLSLINHNPNLRPTSTELLRSGLVPIQTEDEVMRAALRALSDPTSEFRLELVNRIIADALTSKSLTGARSDDTASLLKEYMYDFHGWATPEVSESLLRKDVKDHLTSIFRRHGALEVDRPVLFPFSPHYDQHANSVYKIIDADGTVLQLPLDLTLPYARVLAKYQSPGPKTYTFGDVYRAVPSGGHPRTVGEVDFDIISYDSLDLALREAEAIKVLDEIVDEFPSMAAVPMCYHINHSSILDAILDACDVPPSKKPAVKEVISRLHIGEHTWATVRSELRNPPVSVPATSVEELITYDFRDTCGKAFTRLRSKFHVTADLELTFSHLNAVATYLERFNVKRKIYVNPLASYNEKFYRGNILFQCIYDSKRKNVFAAGGRYDELIKDHQLIQNPNLLPIQRGQSFRGNNSKVANCHAVGFNLSWQDLHRSMVRYHKGSTKRTPKAKKDQETNVAWPQVRRCDVLVDSFDNDLLRTTGLGIIQDLWKLGLNADLAMGDESGQDHEVSNAYTLGQESLPYLYLVHVKQEGSVKIRSVAHNEESELRTSEVASWFKTDIMHRERAEDHGRKLVRYHSQPEQGVPSIESGSDVQVLRAQTKGKKTNRRAIIEEALAHGQEFLHGLADGNIQVVAIETKDDVFEGIRETRLEDADSWKKFIQRSPAGERAYLQDVQELLKEKGAKAKVGFRTTLLYNFRTGSCIWYDLGHSA
ncbi:MAG: hypothetical protein L6R35_002883 [Caloplaca aegaea]|nr:MAG: hypothetical protein L6R35_002883 [Caloplaca aegaea]